ncbi:MAG: divalent metal cation transporter, partial [Verrucomicrobia bacterium]|nr:divalent metal cation transporter [Verrucomicrobiota bacterium]
MSEGAPIVSGGASRSPGSSEGAALILRNPLDWFRIFGPGAVIASLTIGAGELIFSSRGGALFGYRLLWFFALILVFKWALVFA